MDLCDENIEYRAHLPDVLEVALGPAVAGDGEVAGLGVQREELEVHGAGEGERHADAVQDVAVGEDAHVEVGLDDVVELAVLLVTEEGVRHPHLPVRSIST